MTAEALRRRRISDSARAAFSALTAAAGVVTSRPDQIRVVLGDAWHIVEA